ncbi:MAG: hypothetical protein AMXMBFR56_72370 [Polyangiaceae bacterium]
MAKKAIRKDKTKRCARCKAWKPRSEFARNAAMADGLAAYCRPCKREADRGTPRREISGASKEPVSEKGEEPRKYLRGRPSKLTPEVIEKLCSALARNHSRRAAAAHAGISESTLHQWLSDAVDETSGPKRDLLLAVQWAEGDGEFRLVEQMNAAAEIDPVHTRWLLERRYSMDWARREAVSVEVDAKPLEVNVVRELLAKRIAGMVQRPAAPVGGAGSVAGAPASGDGAAGAPAPASPASGPST